MKSLLKSELIDLLNKHRDNDVFVEFDGYEIPITGIRYDPAADQIRLTTYQPEVNVVKQLIWDKGVRVKIGNLPRND